MPKFKEIQIGDSASIERVICLKDIETFSNLTGDKNPLHVDQSFAEKSKFGSRVAHGMLTSSFISTLIGVTLPGEGSIITNISLDFRKPVFIDDSLRTTIEVTKKIDLSKQVHFKIKICNQHSEVVISGIVKAICRE
ncbi:MAG TPA: MaoC family dehydratase [Nitrospinaceae bacterium]|jgi:3-hydroxybutyryl-CoA dehydratase|nr:MaoC family dehydratase [Nitrospina sp.]HIN87116.1 MaoC family dehydratase [Nitrospinaceae bacterium]HIO23910.1 MaoC family dehydratase [Nitrospinaceae bacterium]